MKKLGVTLAEVLITLGIIGVVAALTAPSLVQNAGLAQTGPTLAKVVSTLENAHDKILIDQGATSLYTMADTTDKYLEFLSQNIRKSSYETDAFQASDFEPSARFWDGNDLGLVWNSFREFRFSDSISFIVLVYRANIDSYEAKSSFLGPYAVMYVDINGIKTKPNTMGKDIFQFFIDKSGQVIPAGSNTYAWLKDDDSYKYSAANSDWSCNEDEVGTGRGCAGSILENNRKVIYQ